MTYTECYMAKYAKDESQYEQIAEKMKAEDADTVKGMNTVSGQELLWSLLGAGLGAGSGYFLSKRFRRDGSKRQRALDVLLGALIGAGGTQLALSLPGDEKSGLSLRQVMRADKLIGDKARDNSEAEKYPNPLRLNGITLGTTAAGGAVGGWIGNRHGLFGKGSFRQKLGDKAMARIKAEKWDNPDLINKEISRAQHTGATYDTLAGIGAGALGGYGVGVAANAAVDALTRDSYAGGAN